MPAQTKKQPDNGQPKPGEGKRAKEFIAAFNKGDAKAVAGFWMPDGDYIDQAGHKYKGRAAIEKLYAKLFAASKGSKLTIRVTSHKLLSPEVGLEEGMSEVTPGDGGPATFGAFSAVVVKKDGEWYFQSVHETIVQPPSNAQHFDDIEWLIGEWVSEKAKDDGGKGAAKDEGTWASYTWAENRNFIVQRFSTTLNGAPVIGGTQWIAWDAVDKKIRSFSFYSGGGFGEATWAKSKNSWAIKITAKTAQGKTVAATNILTRVDNDHATWQMTKLTVDGESMPDMPLQKIVRVKPGNPK
jgi:uncharacterized protein (TIGR02246 family)